MNVNRRIGGLALIVAAAGTIVGMAHHPTSVEAGLLGPTVHGALIFFLALTAFGFASFAVDRGGSRSAILGGIVCYAIGLFGHLGAATINGFIVPALAADGAYRTGGELAAFAWSANQALATLGVVAAGAAITLWSLDLLWRPGVETRVIGLTGIVAGIAAPALLAADLLAMNVAGASLLYALQAGWGALVGVHLIRRKTAA